MKNETHIRRNMWKMKARCNYENNCFIFIIRLFEWYDFEAADEIKEEAKREILFVSDLSWNKIRFMTVFSFRMLSNARLVHSLARFRRFLINELTSIIMMAFFLLYLLLLCFFVGAFRSRVFSSFVSIFHSFMLQRRLILSFETSSSAPKNVSSIAKATESENPLFNLLETQLR